MTQAPARRSNPAWKVALAVLSLLISLAVWKEGLENSFSRPSVSSALSSRQQEMALLANPAIPSPLRPLTVGLDPQSSLKDALKEISSVQLSDRQRLLLAGLESSKSKRIPLLDSPVTSVELKPIQKALLDHSLERTDSAYFDWNDNFRVAEDDPLLNQVVCSALGGPDDKCINRRVANKMALRLTLSQGFPVIALILGAGLLLRQCWLFFRGNRDSWPALSPIPLSILDMVLLISGGFVVLGEVVSPAIILPFVTSFTGGLVSPLSDSIKVFIGYCAMTGPPLFILRRQLKSIQNTALPDGGWLQWRLRPWNTALLRAVYGWLMVMPPVLLTGWLMSLFFGDQGGSNPLLQLVLTSRDPVALILLVITTVLLAPLFEELVFRGVLIPVLAKEIGEIWTVFASAFVFALAHLSVSEFPPLFVLGIGLALLRLTSGRLLPCVLMHALWNGITFTNLLLLGG